MVKKIGILTGGGDCPARGTKGTAKLRGGMVKDINEPNKYKWSGQAVIVGQNKSAWQSTDEVLER